MTCNNFTCDVGFDTLGTTYFVYKACRHDGCELLSELLDGCEPQSCVQGAGEGRLRAAVGTLRAVALAAFMKAYPFMHMAGEGLTFSYQLTYLLQSSPYFSPGLHLLQQHVVRTSAQELVSPQSHMLLACCLSGVHFASLALRQASCVLSDSSAYSTGLCYPHPLKQLITSQCCLVTLPIQFCSILEAAKCCT